MLIGAGVGAGTAILSGNDWKTGAVVGAGTAGAGSAMTSNPFTTEALKAGVTNQASNSMMQTLATPGVTSGATSAGVSGVNNSVMQNPDFIGTHLTDDFNSQMLTNNTAGTYTDGVIDPMQAYPDFNNPVSSTAEELAMADGGYGGSIFDGLGGVTDSLSEFTGMDRGDVSSMALNQGASLLQPTPEEKIKHAPMGTGISRPQVDLSKSQGSLLSSNPMTSGAGGQQLTPEQIKLLQQRGVL